MHVDPLPGMEGVGDLRSRSGGEYFFDVLPAGSLSRDDIAAAQTQGGGWSRKQLAAWGVPWPPPKGWKGRLLAYHEHRAG
jgi:hypothetical protein